MSGPGGREPDSAAERMARFLDLTGLKPSLDDPLMAAVATYQALMIASRILTEPDPVYEELERQLKERRAALTPEQRQAYIAAVNTDDGLDDPS